MGQFSHCLFIVFIVLSLLLSVGCDDDDDITGPDPTATPAFTPTPAPTGTPVPTQTPSPHPTSTATPGSRYFTGTWYDNEDPAKSGAIEFTYGYPNRISGSMSPIVHCVSSESPYSYDREYKATFETTTDASGSTFTYYYSSPSPNYNETFEITGTLNGNEAHGTWSYYFHNNSQHYTTTCSGSGTWVAQSQSN